MKRKFIHFIAIIMAVITGLVACKKDDTPSAPTYTIPTTYNFTGVDYSNQTKVLLMADALVNEINMANTVPNTIVTSQRLNDLFTNINNPFSDATLNSSGLKLSDYFTAAAKTDVQNYFDSIGVYSQSSAAAAPGVPGVASSSASPSKKFLLSARGHFYSQIVKKTFMGMCAYQIANAYMKDSINSSTDVTKLSHYWDAAFGFFGVPVDFPANTSGLKYFGSYSNQVNAGLNSNADIMNAFLKGRAAINNNDLTTMEAQADLLIKALDTLNAACIVQEMHETNEHIEAGDAAAAYGTLSETLGFVNNLKYNTGARVITDDQFTQLLQLLDNTDTGNPDFYRFVGVNAGLTAAQIEEKTNAIEQFIGQVYGFTASQLPLL
jgi:hypothetical protein